MPTPANLTARLMRKPRRCAIRSITSTISISRTSRKCGGAAAWSLPGCLISPPFPCWGSPPPDHFRGASRIRASWNVGEEKRLRTHFAIAGFAGNDFDTQSFRKSLAENIPKFAALPIDPKLWDWIVQRIYYVKGDFSDAGAYKRLEQQIAEADKKHNTLGNRLFYLAVAPRFFSSIVKMLGQCCLSIEEENRWSRVMVEKPFGHDLASAKHLNQELKQVITEKQIYRINHNL